MSNDVEAPVHKFLGVYWRFDLYGVHHLYYGLIFLALALGLSYIDAVKGFVSWLFYVPGWLMAADDVIQHWVQARERFYKSPVHQFYAKVLWPMPWVQRLNRWADSLFSKKGK